jgi:hypothetical protein
MRLIAAATSAKRTRRLRIGANNGPKSGEPNAVAPATVTWRKRTGLSASSGGTLKPPAGGTSMSAVGLGGGVSRITSRPRIEGDGAIGTGVTGGSCAWASGALKLSAAAAARIRQIEDAPVVSSACRDTGRAQHAAEQAAVRRSAGSRAAAADIHQGAAVGAVRHHLRAAEHRRRDVDRGRVGRAVGRGRIGAEQAGRAAARAVGADQGTVQQRRAVRSGRAGGRGRGR